MSFLTNLLLGTCLASRQKENVGMSVWDLLVLGSTPSVTECTNTNITGFEVIRC